MEETEALPKIFDTLYDIKTKTQLHNEIEYLAHRIAGIIRLCEDQELGMDIQSYLTQSYPPIFRNLRVVENQK